MTATDTTPETIELWDDPLNTLGADWPEPIKSIEVKGALMGGPGEWFDGPAPVLQIVTTRDLDDRERQRLDDQLFELWGRAGLEPDAHMIGWVNAPSSDKAGETASEEA